MAARSSRTRQGAYRSQRRRPAAPERLQARRERQEDVVGRVVEVLRLMRAEGLSLSAATKQAHTKATTVRDYARAAVHRQGARYVVSESDRLPRLMKFPTEDGTIAVLLRSKRAANSLAVHANAVRAYLGAGDLGPLKAFRGKSLRVGRVTYPFITDPETLERLQQAGELSFEDLYGHSA